MKHLNDIHPTRFWVNLRDNADFLFERISGESEDDFKTYYDFDEAEYDAERDGVTLSSNGFKYYYKEGVVYECLISMESRKCIDINRYSEGQNEGNPYHQDDSLEIRGFVKALLESYSGDEDGVLEITPWAEKYLIEIKKEDYGFLYLSRLNFSVDLNYIQKIFMEKEVKNITELITLLDSIFESITNSIYSLDEQFTVIRKAKHTDNIDKCKTKVKANIKDEFSYIERRKGYDFNDSDQLYNLMVEDREMIEINDDVEDDGESLILKNIEVNAKIMTLNSSLLETTRCLNWLTVNAIEEDRYRTYQFGEVVPEESNF